MRPGNLGPIFGLRFKSRFIMALFTLGLALSGTQASAMNVCEALFQSKAVEGPKEFSGRIRSSKFHWGAVDVDGRMVYYEHLPAKPGKSTAVIFIGLFTPISDYTGFKAQFAAQSTGEGLLIYTYSVQVESLIWSAAHRPDSYRNNLAINMTDLVRQATAVVNAAGVAAPVTAVGFSFGAAPATAFARFHRDRVNNLIFAAPLIVAGDHASSILTGKEMFQGLARMNPFGGQAMVDMMLDRAARQTAERIVDDYLAKKTFPLDISRETVIEAMVSQIRSAENFDMRNEDFTDLPRVSFLLAGLEGPSRLSLQQEVAKRMLEHGAYAGRVKTVKKGEHAILAAQPKASVEFILRIMRDQK